MASLLVIGASVYCYFQTPSLKQSTYAPVILIGSGMSMMYVMALVFVTELIGDDKVRFVLQLWKIDCCCLSFYIIGLKAIQHHKVKKKSVKRT